MALTAESVCMKSVLKLSAFDGLKSRFDASSNSFHGACVFSTSASASSYFHASKLPSVQAVATPSKPPSTLPAKRSKVEIYKESNFLRYPANHPNVNAAAEQVVGTNRGVLARSAQNVEGSFDPSAPRLYTEDLPTQTESVTAGGLSTAVEEYRNVPDIDYLQELIAIQQQGARSIGFFGTRNMGFMHQQLIEILSYAMIITNNHIYTSGASGTNSAVIRGALRAERPDLLTVILPQSLKRQPPESQELLAKVKNVIEKPYNDQLPLIDASRLCNMDILSNVEQVICFAFHDSRLLMETCQEAKAMGKLVTLFYLD